MKVALAGATGNMGRETLKEILKIDEIELVRILVLPKDKEHIRPRVKVRAIQTQFRMQCTQNLFVKI